MAPQSNETRIPTMAFRWLVPSFAAYGEQPDCRRLQQLFHTARGARLLNDEKPRRPKPAGRVISGNGR